jgi:hypothetical protein
MPENRIAKMICPNKPLGGRWNYFIPCKSNFDDDDDDDEFLIQSFPVVFKFLNEKSLHMPMQ